MIIADRKYRKIKKKFEAIQIIQQKRKTKKTYQRHDKNNEEIIVIHNIDANKMECIACKLKRCKIKKCQTKHCEPKENSKIKTRNMGRNVAIRKYQKH